MLRITPFLLIVVLIGCKSAEDRPPPPPLPDGDVSLTYSEVYLRLRQIAWRANESFYRDQWGDLEEASKELAKAGRLLRQATDAPPHLGAVLKEKTDALIAEADKLKASAAEKNAARTNEIIQRVHMLIRDLRPEPPTASSSKTAP